MRDLPQIIDYDKDKLAYALANALKEREDARDVLEEVSLYLSSGIGDENTTAQQYKERILDGIKHLAGHAWEERCKFERERDEARELVRAYQEYTKLLGDEINDTAAVAYVHGWRTNRYEEGKVLRDKIKRLEETK